MYGLSAWDWLALGAYLVSIVVIGVWTSRRIKDTADFFMGGRGFGKVSMIFYSFGAGTSGNDAVGVAAKTYTNGLSGIWYAWLWLFATPFYWLIAPAFRRMRAITTGDYFEYRYGPLTAALYTLVGVMQLSVNIGVILLASSKFIEAISDGAIGQTPAVIITTVLFVGYGMAGGLAAAIVTDLLQGILTIILSFMILPVALKLVGGFTGLHQTITDDHMFSLVAPGEINAFHIAMFGLNALIGIVTQPHIMSVCAAGRTEMDGRVGFSCGNLLKRVCTVAWMLTGLCGVALYMNAETEIHPDLVYGTMARELLPTILPGLVGIFLAALLASVMSSCDAAMVSSSGLFTQNFYRRYVKKGASEDHYVTVGRVAALIIVVVSIAFALQASDVPTGLETFWKIQAMMGAAFWVGLYWRRATPQGAWAGTLGAFAVMYATNTPAFHAWAVANLPEFMIWEEKFRVSWQMFAYLTTGFGLCILVSLFTPRLPKAKLDRFYNCLHTPVRGDEPHIVEPFSLPVGVEPDEPRLLFKHPDMEFPRPSAVGMIGFFAIWAAVGVMVWFVFAMAKWGT